jgi:PilZ domain
MPWPDQDEVQDRINGERRFDRRYDIALDLRWKLVRRRKVLESGNGRTVDLSSGGVRFDSGRLLPIGATVELSIAWPALLHNVSPMQLVITGRIIRSTNTHTAIHMVQHEFRTAGTPQDGSARTARTPLVVVQGGRFGKFEVLH